MTPIIILAAGASTRLGRAKQTLIYKKRSLLKHAIGTAVNAAIGLVIVVIGANEEEIRADVKDEDSILVINENWKDGMSSSIKEGLDYVLKHHDDAKDIILMVCDQPHVNEELLKSLVDIKSSTSKPLVACSYKNTVGVPALFDKQFFTGLLALTNDEGGKKVLLNHLDLVATIPFAAGEIDIDTISDYEALND